MKSRFALVDNIRMKPQPKQHGICQLCGSEMVSKCGKVIAWHWAHKSRKTCDPWWENETQWHKDWKNQFSEEWQEIVHTDESTNEKHIADVKNPYGLVVEFQHSPIKQEERLSRENFYDDMVWVIDGNRNSLDKDYFRLSITSNTPIQKNPVAYRFQWISNSRLIPNWLDSTVKVFFDFEQDVLWRIIIYDKDKNLGAVAPIKKVDFINDCLKGNKINNSRIN